MRRSFYYRKEQRYQRFDFTPALGKPSKFWVQILKKPFSEIEIRRSKNQAAAGGQTVTHEHVKLFGFPILKFRFTSKAYLLL